MIHIGMVIQTESKPCRDVMLSLMDFAGTHPDVRLRLFHASPATTVENLATFASFGFDGLFLCGLAKDVVYGFLKSCPNHPPLALCVYTLPADTDFADFGPGVTVIVDNAAIGHQAADFLLDRGLSNFAFFGSMARRESIAGELRCVAFEARIHAVLGERGAFTRWFMGTQMPNGDYLDPKGEDVEHWVSSLPLPCGVFANGDREAYILERVCLRLGIDIPGQMEILGINNANMLCERAKPTLTSLELDYYACAESAITMLLALIADPALPHERRIARVSTCRIIERGSTSVSRNRGNIVTRAREYIRVHACEGIGVPEVVDHLGVSRRLLEKLIREATGQTPLELIQSVKLDSCRHLLETTNLPIAELLERSGYPLTANPGRVFRNAFGMSMKAYRDAHRR